MNKFKCQQCGTCCTAVPIHIDIYNKFKDKLSMYARSLILQIQLLLYGHRLRMPDVDS